MIPQRAWMVLQSRSLTDRGRLLALHLLFGELVDDNAFAPIAPGICSRAAAIDLELIDHNMQNHSYLGIGWFDVGERMVRCNADVLRILKPIRNLGVARRWAKRLAAVSDRPLVKQHAESLLSLMGTEGLHAFWDKVLIALRFGVDIPTSDGQNSSEQSVRAGLRFQVLMRDDFRCVYCGATPSVEQLHVDHKVARSEGGSNAMSNLVTSCESCNVGKGRLRLVHGGTP